MDVILLIGILLIIFLLVSALGQSSARAPAPRPARRYVPDPPLVVADPDPLAEPWAAMPVDIPDAWPGDTPDPGPAPDDFHPGGGDFGGGGVSGSWDDGSLHDS
ncbi:MAG: hypothetical protein WCO11_04960 [Sphingomonadales bacterium]|jgi:hypothetical protein